jgi:type I restriction enzyme S subunit
MAKKSKNARVPASLRESEKEDCQSGLLPKLRFPEFVDEPIRTASLGEVTEECTGRRGKQLTSAAIMGVSKADGIVPMEERHIGKDTTRYKLLSPDWFAYNPMRINIGSFARWRGDCDVLVSPDYMVFRCIDDHESGISADYLDQFRSSLQWERFVSGNGDGGVRIRIYYKDLALLSMGLPSLLEQRKIASCLSTLDELIGAQGRKVAALRTHKKGLMQQLFPCEGETQPRLRFPEFQDAGDWESKRLIALCKRIMDGTHFSPKTKEGPRPYLTSKNIRMGWLDLSTVSYISEVEHKSIYARCPVEKYDVLLTKDGANTGNCAINNIDGQFSLLSSVAVLRGDPEQVTQHFLYQAIASDGMQSTIANSMTGQAITRITLEKLGNYAVSVPSISEQQRIASCLSSLDELITAETQKLEALKTHKRGLMQQLFPSPEDAS